MNNKERPVSPINGQPLPQGRPFRTSEQAREAGKKGGKKSAALKAARKTLREELLELLQTNVKAKDGTTMQTQRAVSTALLQKALKGDTKAYEIIRDTIGEKPIEKVMVADVDQSVVDEVERIVFNED